MSRNKATIVTLVIFLTMTACSSARRTERADLAQSAKTELIGLTKIELLTCAGVPVRAATEGGLEFMSYDSGFGWGGSCVVTFVLQNGSVTKISYTGSTGRRGQTGEQCAYAVANCLTPNE